MRRHTRTIATVSAIALLAGAGLVVTERLTEGRVARELAAIGLSAQTVSADMLSGRVTAHGLAGSVGGHVVRIGEARLTGAVALAGPALAAGDVVLRDIRLGTDQLGVTIPRLEVTAASASEAEIAAIFDRNAATPVWTRLAKLSARSASIPELSYVQSVGDVKQTATYRDIRLTNLANGRVERIEGAGATAIQEQPKVGKTSTALGKWWVENTDFVQMARFYGDIGKPDEPMQLLYGRLAMEDFRISGDAGFTATIARLTGEGMKARPGTKPLLDVLNAASRIEQDKLPEAERNRIAADTLAIWRNVEVGAVEASGISIVGKDKDKTVTATIRRIGTSGGSALTMTMDDMAVDAGGSRVGIKTFAIRDLAIAEMMAATSEVLSRPDLDPDDIDATRFIPKIGAIEVMGVTVDAPGGPGRSPPVKATLDAFRLAFPQTLGTIPTAVKLEVANAAFDVPAQSADKNFQQLRALGYQKVNVSFGLDTAWDEKTNDLRIAALTANGADMGAVAISGTLGNITKDVFSGNSALAQAALIGATASSLDISVRDQGLVDRWIAFDARLQKRKPEDVRRDYATAAGMLAPGLLGPGEASRVVGAALGRFIAKPGKLDIKVRTRDGKGIGFMDMMLAGNPVAVIQRLDIEAKAE